jgi:hypothetical protein
VDGDADHRDAAVVGLAVGPDACEGGQERVVDVDDPRSEPLAEPRDEDLRVLGHDQQVGTGRLDQVDDGRLLVGAIGVGDRPVVEGNGKSPCGCCC